MSISYQLVLPPINKSLATEMAELYSNHYGFWGETSKNNGSRIKLSSSKIMEWVDSKNFKVSTARSNEQLIGYAIAIQEFKNKQEKTDIISWVTQLVVHQDHRQKGVSKELLFSFWGFSTYYAWGVMSSNPYTIRSLEKMTCRRVQPLELKREMSSIISFGKEYVSYLNEQTEFIINSEGSKVNTEFPASLSKVKEKLNNVTSPTVPWELGSIDEGWEWFAFTFNSQEKIKLTRDEMIKMLDISDDIAHQAYSRMLMDSEDHHWARHTNHEINFIEKYCDLSVNDEIVDFGCGMGRHAIELANRNFSVLGIDYSSNLLNKAKENSKKDIFIKGDCRSLLLEKEFNVALCIYDVIGSYTDNNENIKILENIYNNLARGGYALISVMNHELTKHLAKYSFSFEKEPNKLLELVASSIMEKTGDIFNPDHYMLDTNSNVVYRREQFDSGNELQKELIVRDYRYSKQEIEDMSKNVGFSVVMSRYVQAGKWDVELDATNEKAKEILLLCRKV